MTNNKKIEKNMLRERAKKLPEVTEEMWLKVNEDYRLLVEEYISSQSHSPKTKIQYKSVLRQFGWFIFDSLNNKPLYKIKKRDFIRYLSYLRDDRRMSSSAQAIRKATVSSLCNYIENIVAEDDDNYENFRNFTRGLPAIPKNVVYEKEKITYDEYQKMMEVLEDDENYLGMAWLATSFNVGSRRSETIQFKTEILEYDFPEDATFIYSHNVRLKGSGVDGKIEPYMINREAIKYMKLWVEKRGYDHEYIFTTKHNGEYKQMDSSWANYFCSNVLSYILGRRINPHLYKSSCITFLLESGVPIELVSKYIAHHEQISTTIQHYDLRTFDEERNNIFGNTNKTN
ncbi:site-specific integrase [Ureibacillus chungkukjangi]|uniref:tyrosine-type recombinase/integrase n=1 Tax=Ureibacillus chungkukjangi TaxID=1202712 RepID=UPI00203EAAD1|nr:tyrosine-type recombinase/integrase [Ureibacillus chungkukjangi]MCM3387335.1 site-specific integrase [Ureibacillus chungkukjangi]